MPPRHSLEQTELVSARPKGPAASPRVPSSRPTANHSCDEVTAQRSSIPIRCDVREATAITNRGHLSHQGVVASCRCVRHEKARGASSLLRRPADRCSAIRSTAELLGGRRESPGGVTQVRPGVLRARQGSHREMRHDARRAGLAPRPYGRSPQLREATRNPSAEVVPARSRQAGPLRFPPAAPLKNEPATPPGFPSGVAASCDSGHQTAMTADYGGPMCRYSNVSPSAERIATNRLRMASISAWPS